MNTFDEIKIIGLIGQSGAGKTTVSHMFSSLGLAVIDCDVMSRRASELPEFLGEVKTAFPDCVDENGLMRHKLGEVVFNDAEKLREYGKIIFPYITRLVFRELHRLSGSGERAVILDAPTLFESGLDVICDTVVSVIAPFELKLERVIKRDGISEEFARSRLKSQFGEEFFRSRSEYCIVNSGDISELEKSVAAVVSSLKERFDAH